MKRPFSNDPLTGTETTFEYHDEDDSFSLHTTQQVDDVLDSNKASYTDADCGWKGDMHKVASIPMTLFLQLKQQGIVDDPVAFRAWLNDPNNRYFRTKPGKV